MSAAWWQLEMQIPASAAAEVEIQLLAAGADAVTFLELDDREAIFTEGHLWQISQCQGLFAASTHTEADIFQLIDASEWQKFTPTIVALADQDWVTRTQAEFPARQFGRLWVVPSWDQAPANATYRLYLDPGQAFGTGAHPTTSLCLHFLERQVQAGNCVLDYGCGSGILAIAALLLGAEQAYGVDTDPTALRVATSNADQNQVAQHLHLSLPGETQLPEVDILVANILADPLYHLAPILAAHTKIGGWIALSGILQHQEDQIRSAYAPYFTIAAPQHEEDWSLLYGQRKSGD